MVALYAALALASDLVFFRLALRIGELRDSVASAGGTTIAGLHMLESGAVRGSIMSAVKAAAERATQLGSEKL